MMSKNALVTLLTLVAIVLGIAAFGRNFTPQTVQAQQPKQSSGSFPQSWEYCAITSVATKGTVGRVVAFARITYFGNSGEQNEESFEREVKGLMDANTYTETTATIFAQAIAKLGAEGWEMVGEAPYFGHTVMYFKRAKRQ
jgi:hypothetical protein